ncbi:MAG TPA: Ig-like domain-containing protein, partial [Terriglobales bacterium]
MKNKILVVISMLLLGLAVACAGGTSGGGDGGRVTVSVSPSSATVIAGQTQKFTATVSGALNSTVAWNVTCSGSSCGTIDSTGLYTAPALIAADASVTVRAVSQEDTNIVATATISQKAVAVTVSPNSSATLISGDTKQFTSTVSNAPDGHGTFTWSVSGGGAIDANGLYTAPAKVTADATVTVTVTSDFDTTKKASVTLNLMAPAVSLNPSDMVMEAGAQQLFTPTVSYVPAGQNGVSWNLTGLGSIASGLYSAPTLVTTHHSATIRAISTFDTSKSAEVVVTMDPVVIVVSPKTSTLDPQQTRQFSAALANHINKSVTWSVSGESCGGGSCGTINANGLYTAPSSISSEFTVSVVATSVADVSKSDSAVVTLKPITVTVSPKTASVKIGTAQQFNATVLGGTNTNVLWSLSGSGCTGSTCGTIDAAGLYTAPATVPSPATVTVKAAAVADPSRFDTATVTVIYDPNIKL